VDGTERGNFSAEGDGANVDAEFEWDSSVRLLIEPNDATDTVDGRRAIHTRLLICCTRLVDSETVPRGQQTWYIM
jgi:hypothetical protein